MLRLLAVICAIAALFCFSLPAQAHVFTVDECQYLGYLVYQIGLARDQGMTQEDLEKQLLEDINRVKDDPNAFIIDAHDVQMIAQIVDDIYKNPDVKPLDAGKMVMTSCQNHAYRSNT